MFDWSEIHSEPDHAIDLDQPHITAAGHEPDPAEDILRAVIPDVLESSIRSAPEPLPVAQLLSSRREGSISFALARVDHSGRAADRLVAAAAAWRPGEAIEVVTTSHAVVFRPHPNGLLKVTQSRRIALPAVVRHRFSIEAGDRILLAAFEEHRVVVAYPLATLDRALAAFHVHPAG